MNQPLSICLLYFTLWKKKKKKTHYMVLMVFSNLHKICIYVYTYFNILWFFVICTQIIIFNFHKHTRAHIYIGVIYVVRVYACIVILFVTIKSFLCYLTRYLKSKTFPQFSSPPVYDEIWNVHSYCYKSYQCKSNIVLHFYSFTFFYW